MSEREPAKVWWAEPKSALIKRIQIKPYFADVDLQVERHEDMAEMERFFRSYRFCANK